MMGYIYEYLCEKRLARDTSIFLVTSQVFVFIKWNPMFGTNIFFVNNSFIGMTTLNVIDNPFWSFAS